MHNTEWKMFSFGSFQLIDDLDTLKLKPLFTN